MNKKVLIVAAYHKQAYIPNSDIILPMQVGASMAKFQLDMVQDNAGDNISNLSFASDFSLSGGNREFVKGQFHCSDLFVV